MQAVRSDSIKDANISRLFNKEERHCAKDTMGSFVVTSQLITRFRLFLFVVSVTYVMILTMCGCRWPIMTRINQASQCITVCNGVYKLYSLKQAVLRPWARTTKHCWSNIHPFCLPLHVRYSPQLTLSWVQEGGGNVTTCSTGHHTLVYATISDTDAIYNQVVVVLDWGSISRDERFTSKVPRDSWFRDASNPTWEPCDATDSNSYDIVEICFNNSRSLWKGRGKKRKCWTNCSRKAQTLHLTGSYHDPWSSKNYHLPFVIVCESHVKKKNTSTDRYSNLITFYGWSPKIWITVATCRVKGFPLHKLQSNAFQGSI